MPKFEKDDKKFGSHGFWHAIVQVPLDVKSLTLQVPADLEPSIPMETSAVKPKYYVPDLGVPYDGPGFFEDLPDVHFSQKLEQMNLSQHVLQGFQGFSELNDKIAEKTSVEAAKKESNVQLVQEEKTPINPVYASISDISLPKNSELCNIKYMDDGRPVTTFSDLQKKRVCFSTMIQARGYRSFEISFKDLDALCMGFDLSMSSAFESVYQLLNSAGIRLGEWEHSFKRHEIPFRFKKPYSIGAVVDPLLFSQYHYIFCRVLQLVELPSHGAAQFIVYRSNPVEAYHVFEAELATMRAQSVQREVQIDKLMEAHQEARAEHAALLSQTIAEFEAKLSRFKTAALSASATAKGLTLVKPTRKVTRLSCKAKAETKQ